MAKFYITTSIAYTNAPPHVGFALELIQADVLARYQRLATDDVLFLTGTDEYGTKISKTAQAAGKNPQLFVDEISSTFKNLTRVLNISNDDFIRTTDQERHWPAIHKVWKLLKEKGDIYKKNYQGLYCAGCESFVLKKDLVEGKCQIHHTKPEVVEEENYFFRLSKYANKVAQILKKGTIKIIPESRTNEITRFIEEGVEDISCSRTREKLQWGIPVPDDNTQVIYVWMEALVNYISALEYAQGSAKFTKWWPADVHCIGKDIFRFHSLLWPSLLLSIGLELPKAILVHGFISVGGQKMSKSLGNVVDPFALVEKYGADAVRYYLLREIPTTEDGDFTYEKLEERYNAELASGIGNLVSRVVTMAGDGVHSSKEVLLAVEIKKEIEKEKERYKRAIDEFKLHEALKAVWDFISFCDAFIEKKRPWEKKEDTQKTLYSLLCALAHISHEMRPFLPDTAEKIAKQLGIDLTDREPWTFTVKKGKSLFPRIGSKN